MGLSVLIVDDSSAYLAVAEALLLRDGLAVVGTASTSAQAQERTAALKPDVVLVDINLRNESGFDLARDLAADDRIGGSTVILMSTQSAADVADLVADAPVAGFLPKTELSGDAIRRLAGGMTLL
jgi:DNA-binding NarL/FixJ family response regulator